MRKWYIGSISKTDLCIHPAMFLYALYAFLTGHGLFMAISTLSILLHEGAHAACAVLFGKPPSCIELTPLGAVMHQEDEFGLPAFKRAMMLLAGPALTLLLCLSAIVLTKRASVPIHLGRMLFLCNLSILLLNMLPAFPLDGGRLLALLLGQLISVRSVHVIMRCIGSFLGIGMIALNVFACWKLGGWNLSLVFAGCCLLYSSAISMTTRAMEELRWFVERKIKLEKKGSIRTCWLSTLSNTPLRKLIKRLPPERLTMYLCIEPGSMRLLGCLTESEVIQQYMNSPEVSLKTALEMCHNQRNEPQTDTI